MKRHNRLRIEALDDRCLPSFGAAANYDVGLNPQAVVTADFNNDGFLDLATGNANIDNVPSGNTVSVLLGNADGTFQPARTSTAGVSQPHSIAVGDFDEDGDLDLAATGDDVSVLLGNGDGTFQPPVSLDLGLHELTMSVAVGDFDADGKMDLAVASGYDLYDYGTVTVLRGDGAGGFAASTYIGGLGYSNINLAVADLDGDNRSDVVAAREERGLVTVLLSNGDGTVRRAGDFATGVYPGAVAVGEFTGDGILDLVIADPSVAVLPGNGNGTFGSPIHYSGSDTWHHAVAVADFNRDGKLDLATADPITDNVNVLRGRGDGTFDTPEHFAVGADPYAVAAGDFGGDGWTDVATANWLWPSNNSVSVLINDQNWSSVPPPGVSVGDATVTEGNAGTVAATFTVTLSKVSDVDATVRYATADLAAVAGSDYTAASGDVTIPVGQTSATFTVAVLGDRLFESTEWFAVNLSAATNATIGDGRGLGIILDDEPRVGINDVTVKEGNTGTVNAIFTLTLSNASDVDVTVHYDSADGTAVAASDYAAASGDLTIPAGQTSATFAVAVLGDRLPEPTETFVVYLSAPTNATIGDDQGVGTIVDDEPGVSIGDVTRQEGQGNKRTLFTFTVTLSAAYDQPVTVSYRTVDGTATTGDGDYVGRTGTLTFAPGETTKTITIEVKADKKKEANETFYLDLFGTSNALLIDGRGVGTIVNDD